MVSEKESIFSYLAGRDIRYEKLQKLVDEYETKQANDEDLNEIKKQLDETIDIIQIRHGSNGVVRRQTISYLFKKILEKLVPSHIRYLVYSCITENGYDLLQLFFRVSKDITNFNNSILTIDFCFVYSINIPHLISIALDISKGSEEGN